MPPLIDSLLVLALILVLSRFIKRGSVVLQKLFIPSSLIAGLGGLILGPQVLETIPSYVTEQWQSLPKFFINVVFAGLFLGRYIPSAKKIWKQAGPMIAFGSTMAWAQYAIGSLLTLLILAPIFKANPLSASLIEISFAGGHGTAAGLSSTFSKLGWPEGTDIALALATLSILIAIISGIIFVNIHHRRQKRGVSDDEWKKQQKVMIRSGYNLVRFSEKISTNPKAIAINIMAFAVAIGIGQLLLMSLVKVEILLLKDYTDIRVFSYVPLFPMAMLGGLIVQLILKKIKKQHFIQRRTAENISAISLDLLIASAIATVSLNVVGDNLAIFITLGLAGVAIIVSSLFFLAPKFFKNNWFERGITDYGQAMGMTATGLLLNRLADPSNKLKIKESFAYKQLAFEPFMGGGIVTAVAVVFMYEFGLVRVLFFSSFMTVFWLLVGLRLGRRTKRNFHF